MPRAGHTAYVEYLRNPFSPIPTAAGEPQKEITAASFRRKVDAAVEAHLESALQRPPPPAPP